MAEGKGFGHPGHTPISKEIKEGIALTIIVWATFIFLLTIASDPNNTQVKNNYVNAVVQASAIFFIIVFVATYEVVHYMVTHGIGKPEGRGF